MKDANGAEITYTTEPDTHVYQKTDMQILREDVTAIKAKLGIM